MAVWQPYQSVSMGRQGLGFGTGHAKLPPPPVLHGMFDMSTLTAHLPGSANPVGQGRGRRRGRGRGHRGPPGRRQAYGAGPDGATALSAAIGMPEQTLRACAAVELFPPHKLTYKRIETYVHNSQCHQFKMKVIRIFKVKRNGEEWFSRGRDGKSFRMMLWHGTKKPYVPSIIQNGFKRPAHRGMYGDGVYFADRISKSAQYCGGTSSGATSYLFLCDVNLGRMYKAKNPHNEYSNPPQGGFYSVKGNGRRIPNWQKNEDYFGSIMPIGETIDNKRHETYSLQHNEYIIYDTNQVRIVFLVEVQFV